MKLLIMQPSELMTTHTSAYLGEIFIISFENLYTLFHVIQCYNQAVTTSVVY
jgi:hypothetical protein